MNGRMHAPVGVCCSRVYANEWVPAGVAHIQCCSSSSGLTGAGGMPGEQALSGVPLPYEVPDACEVVVQGAVPAGLPARRMPGATQLPAPPHMGEGHLHSTAEVRDVCVGRIVGVEEGGGPWT